MQLKNSSKRYGAVTKLFHWLVFFGFVFQYFVAAIMTRIAQADSFWGFTQGMLYNWHKSIGIIIFGIVIGRYLWRRLTWLPDWAPTLTAGERTAVHWIERILYQGMFVQPISGYIFVMAGGYGVNFFGVYHLPNPIGAALCGVMIERAGAGVALAFFATVFAVLGMAAAASRTIRHEPSPAQRR